MTSEYVTFLIFGKIELPSGLLSVFAFSLLPERRECSHLAFGDAYWIVVCVCERKLNQREKFKNPSTDSPTTCLETPKDVSLQA